MSKTIPLVINRVRQAYNQRCNVADVTHNAFEYNHKQKFVVYIRD